MFLKAFLVFSGLCSVLYTASVPKAKVNEMDTLQQMENAIKEINCSTSKIQNVNLTRPDNLCPTRQETFCQISKALNGSNCTEPKVQELQRLSRQMQGNANCTLPDNGVPIKMKKFLNDLKEYISSLITVCPRT